MAAVGKFVLWGKENLCLIRPQDDTLALGPEAGTPDPALRTSVPVLWRDTRVAELAADGGVSAADLETVAAAIADLCLVGWDTGGEVWQS